MFSDKTNPFHIPFSAGGHRAVGIILSIYAHLSALYGIPAGIVTAIIGAPYYLYLLLRERKQKGNG
ncbi:hypothetical protein [Paenibacillus sp. 8b26]|uniref:hypothetical protein n=1 Tax=Paenibacillus sp. 8b26 TaxID=3424133 RepID=UPI003D653850